MIDDDASVFGTNELERNLIKLDWCGGVDGFCFKCMLE
jgi:hypothetical protein